MNGFFILSYGHAISDKKNITYFKFWYSKYL